MELPKLIQRGIDTLLDLYSRLYVNLVMMKDGRAPVYVMLNADNNRLVPHRALKIYSERMAEDMSTKHVGDKTLPPNKLYDDYQLLLKEVCLGNI